MTDLIKQIEELNLRCDSSTLLPVILQVEQLIKERDHARLLFCEWSAGSDRPGEAKEDIARDNGWRDLYKNTNQMESTQENNHDEL